eukprot:Hpha_TRINITY_DN16758_c1_g3::TRINITY_DN16758_c1_g3_i1::g.79099::m.79099
MDEEEEDEDEVDEEEEEEEEEKHTKASEIMKKAFEIIAERMVAVIEKNRAHSFVHDPSHAFAEFDCVSEPGVSVQSFLKMLARYLTEPELLQMVIFIGRLLRRHGEMLTCFNAHRLLLTAAVLSVKSERDVADVVRFFSKKSGQSAADLVLSQNLFLSLIDWDLYVPRTDYEALVVQLRDDQAPSPGGFLKGVLGGGHTEAGGLHRMQAAVEMSRGEQTNVVVPCPPAEPCPPHVRKASGHIDV